MENKDYSFLPFLLNENIYLVNEDKPNSNLEQIIVDEKDKNKEQQTNITWQGENKQNVVIIVKNKKDQYLDPIHRAFMAKILSAINLNFDDVAIINLAHYNQKFSIDKLSEPGAHYLISFGIQQEDIQMDRNFILNEIFSRGNIKMLFTSSLEDLYKDRNKKVLFWNNLKKMFQV